MDLRVVGLHFFILLLQVLLALVLLDSLQRQLKRIECLELRLRCPARVQGVDLLQLPLGLADVELHLLRLLHQLPGAAGRLLEQLVEPRLARWRRDGLLPVLCEGRLGALRLFPIRSELQALHELLVRALRLQLAVLDGRIV